MTYKSYIKSHPLFKKHHLKEGDQNDEKWKYEPFYRLGLKLEEKVNVFLLTERDRYNTTKTKKYSGNINDYIPLNSPHPVNYVQKQNLRHLVEDLLEEWPYTSNENKVVAIFWNAARHYKDIGSQVDKVQFSSMKFLDIVARLCGYNDFDNFIQQSFSKIPEIKIVLLPFSPQNSLCLELENKLEHICKELDQLDEYSLKIERPSVKEFEKFGPFTIKDAEGYGKKYMGDFVIWGEMMSPSEITLNLKILKPDMDFFGDGFKIESDNFKFTSIISDFKSKLKPVILWATSTRLFYNKNYAKAIELLKVLLDTGYDPVELNFRIGVLYDLMEESGYAQFYYYRTMNLVEMEGSRESFQKIYDRNYADGIDVISSGNFGPTGNYIDEKKLLDPNILVNEILKLMLFEIVRIDLALKFRERLPKDVFERVMLKIINQVQPSWLKTGYKDYIGKIYYELGVINERRLIENEDIHPDQVYAYYESAALNLEIMHDEKHAGCIGFFKKYQLEEMIIEKMEKEFDEDDEVFMKYKFAFNIN